MRTRKTQAYMEKNGVVGMVADKTQKSLEIRALLKSLGNKTGGIPYYAIFPGNGGEPITFQGLLTESQVLEKLKEAGPSTDLKVAAGEKEKLLVSLKLSSSK